MLKPALVVNPNSRADDSQIYIDGDLRITYFTSKLLFPNKNFSITPSLLKCN